jgi:AraC family transcriptional regulator
VAGFIAPASTVHHIVMPTSAGFHFEARELGTGRWHRHEIGPGELCVLGAGGAPSELCWRASGPARTLDVVELYVHPAALQPDDGRAAAPMLAPEWRVLRDPLLSGLIGELGRGLDRTDSAEELFGELATTLLAVQLERAHGVRSAPPSLLRGGLPPRVLERVREYVASNLSKRIRLQQLASLAGLSPFHFSRAFKASSGFSPNAYVLHCRITEAKRLLSGTRLPVAEIARRTGFHGAGQLSTRFRAWTGTTPTAFRSLGRP